MLKDFDSRMIRIDNAIEELNNMKATLAVIKDEFFEVYIQNVNLTRVNEEYNKAFHKQAKKFKSLGQTIYDLQLKLQSQKKHGEWFDVKERLPETDENVLVWYEYFRYGDYNCMWQNYGIACYFAKHERWFGEDLNGSQVKVLYWTALPKPPEKKE